jgi:O-antigen ligase
MMMKRINDQSTVNSRVVVTDAMLQMIQEKPILGWGYETLNLHIKDYYRSVGVASVIYGLTTSHNTFLTLFVEFGLLGFMFYIFPIGWLLKASYYRLRHHFERNHLLAVIWLGVLGSFVISNFMDMRFFPIGLTFWWMELGLIANLIQQHSETHGVGSSYQSLHKRQVPPSNYELFE